MYFAARRIEQLSAALFAATPTSTRTTATFPRATATNFEARMIIQKETTKRDKDNALLPFSHTHKHTH